MHQVLDMRNMLRNVMPIRDDDICSHTKVNRHRGCFFFWNFFFLENCWLFFPCMKVVRRIDQKESRIYAGDNKLDFPDWNLSAFALSLFFFFLTVSFFLPVASLRAGDSSII